MKKTIALIVLCMATMGLFIQINAQQPILRAAQTEIELLDSIVYVESYMGTIYSGNKKAWAYDIDGHKTHYSWYFWSTTDNNWRGRTRLDSIYNDKGKISTIISNDWNRETGQWNLSKKDELTYNSEGNLVLFFSSSWNQETEDWFLNIKQESTHSYTEENDHIVSSIVYSYNVVTGEWTPHHRNELNYDSNGHQTLYNASFLDSTTNTWMFKVGSFKYVNAYDERGNQTLSSYYTWDGERNQWKGVNQLIESSYDLSGNVKLELTKEWDASLNQWTISRKTVHDYNETGQRLQQITSRWSNTNNDWVAVNKTEYDINELGVVTGILDSEWNIEDRLWVVTDKEIMTYDSHGNVVLNTNFTFDVQSGDFIKNYDVEYRYNESGDQLIEEANRSYYDGVAYISKTNYYYSLHTVASVIDTESVSPVVYPSPFTDRISIQLNSNQTPVLFELFNVQGQKVMSKQVVNAETIPVERIENGVYFYQISSAQKSHRGKIIKR
ncbi:MAG: T9SS type A sorting domain-containing protein [Bacteroidales bacterium]